MRHGKAQAASCPMPSPSLRYRAPPLAKQVVLTARLLQPTKVVNSIPVEAGTSTLDGPPRSKVGAPARLSKGALCRARGNIERFSLLCSERLTPSLEDRQAICSSVRASNQVPDAAFAFREILEASSTMNIIGVQSRRILTPVFMNPVGAELVCSGELSAALMALMHRHGAKHRRNRASG